MQLFADGEMTISRESSDDLREGAFITDILPKIKGMAVHAHSLGWFEFSHAHNRLQQAMTATTASCKAHWVRMQLGRPCDDCKFQLQGAVCHGLAMICLGALSRARPASMTMSERLASVVVQVKQPCKE